MQSLLNSVVIYNGYPLSFVVALTFHGLLLALLVYFQGIDRTDTLELVQPTVIKALFIDENPQVRNERQRLERREQQQLASERERQREEAARQAEAERLQQERNQAQERQQEQERSALLERQEQDRLRNERAEQLDKERQQQEADQRRQRELAEAESQAQERERLRQQQQAASEAVALQAARTEFELVQSGTALIQQIVQENWSRPPSARNGMRAVIQIRMLPTGELVNATITQSSGDAAFDRSAENAVYRAAPFRELQTLPINVFNANFRVLSLIFQPEDLLN